MNVSRRFPGKGLGCVALLLMILGVGTCNSQAGEPEAAEGASTRPNILFVFADDHGWQAVSSYGAGINQTPNIDRLAREGMRSIDHRPDGYFQVRWHNHKTPPAMTALESLRLPAKSASVRRSFLW